MGKLEDAWTKLTDSEEYKNSDDAFKERVKQRFFERTVGGSAEFKSAAPEAQQKIQSRFFERIQPQSGVQKAIGTAEKVLSTKIPVASDFVEGMKDTDQSLAADATKRGEANPVRTAGRALSKGIENLEPNVEAGGAKLAQAKGFGKVTEGIKQAGRIAVAGAEETGKKLTEDLIPENVGQGIATIAAPTVIGKAAELAPKLPIIGKALGADVGQYSKSIIQRLRTMGQPEVAKAAAAEVPGKLMIPTKDPLFNMIDQEMKYESWLKDKSGFNNDPTYKPFTPEVRVNLSQLRDVASDRLEQLTSEPNHLSQLAQKEGQVNEEVAYDNKLQSMGPGRDVPTPTPLSPENAELPQPTGLLQGKEAIANRQPVSVPGQPLANLASTEQNLGYETSKENVAGLNDPSVPTAPEPIIKSEDQLKFGRNMNDITQKPLRTILKEINDDVGSIGSVRLGADDGIINAAKDLRAAIKTKDGKVIVAGFGEPHVAIPEAEGTDVENGFYDNLTKKFISREEAANYLGRGGGYGLLGEHLEGLHHSYIEQNPAELSKIKDASEDIKELLNYTQEKNIKKTSSLNIMKNINKDIGKRGQVGDLGEVDPAKYDRLKQNTRELIRRAWTNGYDSTEEIIGYAARHGVGKEELEHLKGELTKTPDAPLDPRPISDVIQAKDNPDMKNTLWEKVKDRWTPNGKASQVRTLLTKRYGEIAEGQLDSQYFIHNTTKNLTKNEREALAFQGTAPNEEAFRWPDAKKIIGLVNKPTQNMKIAQKMIKAYMDEAHSFLSDNFDDVGYIKNYITQLWDKPSDIILNPQSNNLGTYNPFVQKRSFPDYATGINAGNQPKALDIREILSAYDKYKIKTVANIRFIDELAKMPTPQGVPAVLDAKLAPIGWVKADNVPSLVGKRVHPDYLQAIKVISDAPFSNKALRAYDLLAESQRYASLTLSPFHFGSLFINASLSSSIPFKIPLEVASMTGKYIMKEALSDTSEENFAKKLYKAYTNGHAAFADLPLAKRATRSGLTLGIVGEEQVGKLQNFLLSTEAKLNKFYLSKAIKPIRGVMQLFNKPLWDYAHAGIKLMTWQEHLTENMRRFPEMPVQEIERRTSRFVNDLDGGEAWSTLFVSPQMEKAMHRAFFFPDWMVSRLRTLGTVAKIGTPEGEQAQKYWVRAALTYYTFANWRNYANTKRDLGKGRYMWDNDPGKKMDVFSKTDEKGRSIYTNYAPAVTEVFKWFGDPIKSLGARFNPNLQLMAEFFTGSTLSGYKLPDDKRSFTDIIKRHYMPVVAGGNNELGLFPKSKGISSYEVVKRFEKTIRDGADPSIAISYGIDNGYNVEQLYNIAKRNVSGERRKALLQ